MCRASFPPPALSVLRSRGELALSGEVRRFQGATPQGRWACPDLWKDGGDFTRRFPEIAAAVLGLPARSLIIDGELIAANAQASPTSAPCCSRSSRRRCASMASICSRSRVATSEMIYSSSGAPALKALLARSQCRLMPGFRGDRLKTQGLDLSIRAALWLDQDEMPGLEDWDQGSGRAVRGRGVTSEPLTIKTRRQCSFLLSMTSEQSSKTSRAGTPA
jgi:hypothetical protein